MERAIDPAAAWVALRGDPGLLAAVTLTGPDGLLPSRLPVRDLARSTVVVCALAAAELTARRGGLPVPAVTVDDGAVAAAFTSERRLRVDGREPESFAPLSRFWRTADGVLRTHANYPHHRTRLLALLGVGDDRDPAALVARVATELAGRTAEETQEAAYAAGALAVAVRTPEQWQDHPQGRAVAAGPLVRFDTLDGAPAAPPRRLGRAAFDPGRPLAGLRVLDLTRVLAGPVATRTLALYGADVLRIDPPASPESADLHADTGFGKRSTALDLGSGSGRAAFEDLLTTADVVVTGYRPGALDRFGLAPHDLAQRRPGLVVARLSAWGESGPWSRRRGFDSLVQAATGIAAIEADVDGTPGALPAQALDHGTGYLVAAGVLRMLTRREDTGAALLADFSLAGTAQWLLNGCAPMTRVAPAGTSPLSGGSLPTGRPAPRSAVPPPAGTRPDDLDLDRYCVEATGPLGRIRHVLPPATLAGGPTTWDRPPGLPGADEPAWGP